MATLDEVLRHMTGHSQGRPTAIDWQTHFTREPQPRDGSSDAYTHADFQSHYSFSSRADRDGKHRLAGVRVTVAINKRESWYVAGRQTPQLRGHEQGHYDITFLTARDLCRRLLELEWDSDVLTAVGQSSPGQIVNRLRSDAREFESTARSDSRRLNRLYDDALLGAKNPDGTINPNAQARWDQMINYAIQHDAGLPLLISMAGGNPRTW